MLVAATLLLLSSQAREVHTFTIDGVERKATIIAPANATNAPVVFAFHGHGGNMRQASRAFHVHELWSQAIAVYPDGLPSKGKTDPEGKKQGWQQFAADSGGRDLKFVDAMMAKLKKDYKIDEKRIYVMGHSNGGRFTYLLWAERGSLFAGYGPSGSPAALMVDSFKPKPVFAVAGEKDALVPYAGQRMTHNRLRTLLRTDGSKAKVDGYVRYEPGPNGLELGTYVHPGGHEYTDVMAKLTVEFFKRH